MKKIYNSTIKILLFAGFLTVLTLSGCEKEGAVGPQGEKGEQGIPGADGSTLLSGNGAPATSVGKTGDYYLDKTALVIYGPKTSAGWGEATSLKGATGNNGADGKDGVNGKDGSKILSGTDVPAPSLGAEGDFYFDTQNIAIYGPKTSAGWGIPVSLKAPAANGVTVLLYRNHAFQNVVRNAQHDTYWQSNLQYWDEQRAMEESSMEQSQQSFNQLIANINASQWLTQEQKNQQIAEALQEFESDEPKSFHISGGTSYIYYYSKGYHREKLAEIASQIAKVEQEIAIGGFNVESIINLDSKYHDIYDNGMVVAYVKKSGDTEAGWSQDFDYINNQSGDFYQNLSVNTSEYNTLRNQIIIEGSSYLIPESEVKAARIDIKIVLIPATTIEVMSSKKINTKDLKAVAKYLGI